MDRTKTAWSVAVIVAAAGVCAQAMRATGQHERPPLRLAAASIVADSAYVAEALDADFATSLRAREVLYRVYAAQSDSPVWVFLAYFDAQREGSQVHSPRHCYPGSGWSIEREIAMDATWREGSVHGLLVSDGVERRLVCYWYQMPRGITPDVFRLKLALTRQAALRRPQEVVYGNISTPVDTDVKSAFARIVPFVRDAETQVARLYREQDEHQSGTH